MTQLQEKVNAKPSAPAALLIVADLSIAIYKIFKDNNSKPMQASSNRTC